MSKVSRRPGRRRRKRATYQTRPQKHGSAKYTYENRRRGIKLGPVDPGSTDEQGKHNRVHGPTPIRHAWLKPATNQLFRRRRDALRTYKIKDKLPVLVRVIGR